MLSKLLLVSGSLSLLSGYYCMFKERKLNKDFEEVQKAHAYDLNYINSLADIPKNLTITLCAAIDETLTKSTKSAFNPIKNVVTSFLAREIIYSKDTSSKNKIPESKEQSDHNTFNSEIKHEYYEFNELPLLILQNSKQDRLLLEKGQPEIGMYNVFPIVINVINPTKVTQKLSHTLIQKVDDFYFGRKWSNKYREMGIDTDELYIYIGKVINENRIVGNQRIDSVFKVKYIIGGNKNHFLRYLDDDLTKINKMGKRSFMIAIGIFSINFIKKAYETYLPKTQN